MNPLSRDYVPPTDEAFSWVESERIGLSLTLAVAVAIIYDTVITMDKEVYYFWDNKLSFTKIVFFINRYVGIIGAVMSFMENVRNLTPTLLLFGVDAKHHLYSFMISLEALFLTITIDAIIIFSIDYVLTIRVLVLYRNERKMRIFLYSLLVFEAVGKSVFMVLGTKLEPAIIVRLSPHLTYGGYNDEAPPFLTPVDWTLFLAYGTLLLCLALYKGRQEWKLDGYKGSRLVMVLIRDQALYFTIAIASSIMVIIGNLKDINLVVGDIFNVLGSPIFLCILGSRMFFNLREAAEHGVNGGNWPSLTSIHFDQPANSQHGTETEPDGSISTVSAGPEESTAAV